MKIIGMTVKDYGGSNMTTTSRLPGRHAAVADEFLKHGGRLQLGGCPPWSAMQVYSLVARLNQRISNGKEADST
jgi:hypothetical protein